MSATTRPGFAARSVAEIAAALPGATAVFPPHKLDFCCGGPSPLAGPRAGPRPPPVPPRHKRAFCCGGASPRADAGAARGADLPAVEAELAALVPDRAVAPEDTDALISLIETRYHATHRRELPELIRLARRV